MFERVAKMIFHYVLYMEELSVLIIRAFVVLS
jgi:hypothetical protein